MAVSSSSFVPLILLFLSVVMETSSSTYKDNKEVLHSLFGSHLTALIMAPPTSDDITESSANEPTVLPSPEGLTLSHNNPSGLVVRKGAVPQFLLDFLRLQVRAKGRSHKSTFGGRGCFGMKLDRIGSISGLGC